MGMQVIRTVVLAVVAALIISFIMREISGTEQQPKYGCRVDTRAQKQVCVEPAYKLFGHKKADKEPVQFSSNPESANPGPVDVPEYSDW